MHRHTLPDPHLGRELRKRAGIRRARCSGVSCILPPCTDLPRWGLILRGLSHPIQLSMPGPHLGVNTPGARICTFQPEGMSLAPPFQLLLVQVPENKPVSGGSDSDLVTPSLLKGFGEQGSKPPKGKVLCPPPATPPIAQCRRLVVVSTLP